MRIRLAAKVLPLFVAACLLCPQTRAQHAIDSRKSVLKIRVFKAGVFSAFGHDHEISAPLASGSVDTSKPHVELRFKAGTLKVEDPKVSAHDRQEISKAMLGPEVLDVERFPDISFRSTKVEPVEAKRWKVSGTLTLHGQTKPVTVEVRESQGHYVGHTLLKQTDFGIRPIRIAGGTVRVKDEIRIEFDIQLTS
ncbi:MAG: YceI family protein [Acidobacteria bacterium]|nr:YceI family protein [Acidobacteriota bacterium]